jgi:O-antigen/teichoic acid export membrane protein
MGDEKAKRPTKLLLSNIAWMLMGNLLYGASQWAALVALAKLGTVEMVGIFVMALAICLPALMFSSLSLRSLHVTDYDRSYRFLEYIALRLIAVFLSVAVVIAFTTITRSPMPTVIAMALISAAKGVEYISDILYGLLQQQEDMAGIGISMATKSTVSVASLSAGLYFTHSLVWSSVWFLGSSLGILVIYDLPKVLSLARLSLRQGLAEGRNYMGDFIAAKSYGRLLKLASLGLPMGFVLMMVSLNLNIPRYFIREHLGVQELAIFSAIATLLAAGGVVTNALGQAAAPRMAKHFGNREWTQFGWLLAAIAGASLALGAFGLAGAILFGRQAMTLMYKPEYSTRQDVLVWLMAASGFFYLGSTLGYAVTAVRCFAPQLPLFAGAAVATALGCLFLVPSQGLRGAAIAILLSGIVQCLGSAWLLYDSCRKARHSHSQVPEQSSAASLAPI